MIDLEKCDKLGGFFVGAMRLGYSLDDVWDLLLYSPAKCTAKFMPLYFSLFLGAQMCSRRPVLSHQTVGSFR